MEKMTPVIMVCDRIEEGRFCILTDEKKNVLSVPLQNLSTAPTAHEAYTVSFEENGSITLAPAPDERQGLLCRIRALRKRLLLKRGQDGDTENKTDITRQL